MSIQINTKRDSASIEYYQELNRFLQKEGNDNQSLYQFLQKAKKESINQLDTNIQVENLKHFKAYHKMFSANDQLNYLHYEIDQTQPMLQKTEDRIFREVTKLMLDIKQLETELTKEKKKAQVINTRLNLLKSNNHAYLCESAQRQQQLIIKDSQIEEVKKEIETIQKKTDLMKMLNQDIEPLLEQQEQRNQSLRSRHERIEKEKRERQQTLKCIEQLEEQVRLLGRAQSSSKSENSQQYEDQIIDCLRQRLQIEQYLQNEQKQKQQFMKALQQFKQKYQQVKKTNKSLKDSLQTREIDYSFIQVEKQQL